MRTHALPRNAAATILALLVAAGLPAASVAGADPADTAAYEASRKKVGRDAEAHVRLALWCEQHGLTTEGVKHLALAVLIDPKNSHARGLMGLVEFGGRWRRPDAVGEAVRSDEVLAAALAEYTSRRARTRDTADAQWKLALWCGQDGLESEAVAHLTAVTRLDPGREAAWERLGYRKNGGRWVTDAQLAAEKAEAEAQKKADRHWKPLPGAHRSLDTPGPDPAAISQRPLLRHAPEVRAVCGNSARTDLCGGTPARAFPTATPPYQRPSETPGAV